MYKAIWKYELEITGKQTLHLPIGAEMLCVQMQGVTPCLWALVKPYGVTEDRYIETFGTGHNIGCDMGIDRAYIGTYQTIDKLVFHVFERTD